MNNLEYKIIRHTYTKDEQEKIDNFNKEHTDMAKLLLKYNRDSLLNNTQYANMDITERIKYVQRLPDFVDFCKAYPIVSKYIIAFGLFSTKAFIKYLNWKSNVRPSDFYRTKLVNNPREQELWKNKYVYSIYIKYLSQEKNNHCNLNEINRIYLESVNTLNEETNAFFDLYEAELKKNEELKLEYTQERKNKIKDQLKLKLEKKLN